VYNLQLTPHLDCILLSSVANIKFSILFGPRKYATNKFMDNFRNYCRFIWSGNPEDTFTRDNLTGVYSYSSEFVERQNDLRSWSMRSDFFSLFPELRQDVRLPPLSQSVVSVHPKDFAGVKPLTSRRFRHSMFARIRHKC